MGGMDTFGKHCQIRKFKESRVKNDTVVSTQGQGVRNQSLVVGRHLLNDRVATIHPEGFSLTGIIGEGERKGVRSCRRGITTTSECNSLSRVSTC